MASAAKTFTSLTPTNRDDDDDDNNNDDLATNQSVTPQRLGVSSTTINSSIGTVNSNASNFVHNLHTPHNSPYSHVQYEHDVFAIHHSHSPQALLASQLAESTSGMITTMMIFKKNNRKTI